MRFAVAILIAVVLALVAVAVFGSRGVWEIRVRDGVGRVVHGTVPGDFVADCVDILGDSGVHRARVWAVRRGPGLELRFSGNVPESARQRLRNAWGML